MKGAASLAAIVLAVVFARAAVAKGMHRATTATAFEGIGLPAAPALATVVPVVELGLAVVLVVRPDIGGALALGLLAVFTIVIVRGLVRGVRSGCGCFGSAGNERLSAADVVRNGLLGAFAVVATGTSRLVSPDGIAIGATLVGCGAAVALQALAQHTLGRARA